MTTPFKLPEPVAWYSAKVDGVITDTKKRAYMEADPLSVEHYNQPLCYVTEEQMRSAIEEAVRQEREACAQAVDDIEEKRWYGYENPNTFQDAQHKAAAAIRERSTLPPPVSDGDELPPLSTETPPPHNPGGWQNWGKK